MYKRTQPSHLIFSGETQAFTNKCLIASQLLSFPPRLTHSQVPALSSICLLYSLHNAGINFSKPIWAAARFSKERRAELLCWGKFPLHTSLEVDCSPLYAACFNLHTEQWEWGIEGGQEGERALNTQLGITNVFTEVLSAFPCASLNPFASFAISLAFPPLTFLDSFFSFLLNEFLFFDFQLQKSFFFTKRFVVLAKDWLGITSIVLRDWPESFFFHRCVNNFLIIEYVFKLHV